MKIKLNVILNAFASVGQVVNLVGNLVPTKYQLLIAGVLAGAQGIISALAQYKNPDGTPAKVAYVAPSK